MSKKNNAVEIHIFEDDELKIPHIHVFGYYLQSHDMFAALDIARKLGQATIRQYCKKNRKTDIDLIHVAQQIEKLEINSEIDNEIKNYKKGDEVVFTDKLTTHYWNRTIIIDRVEVDLDSKFKEETYYDKDNNEYHKFELTTIERAKLARRWLGFNV